MTRCIAFLRAVNVGGRVVRMDALRAGFEALGLTDVETFIASGNVVFETRARAHAPLERRIEAALQAAFGFGIDTFIRSAEALAAITAHPAFGPAEAASAATHAIGFLGAAPEAAGRHAIDGLNSATDRFVLHERELHWLSRNRQSESTFSNALLERLLGTRSTFRSITTLRRLVEKYPSRR